MTEIWSKEDFNAKVESEGGWWDFYMWGGLDQRTGDVAVDGLLTMLQELFSKAEPIIGQLDMDLEAS